MLSRFRIPAVSRLGAMVIAASFWVAAISARLIHLQVNRHEYYRSKASARQERHVDLPAKRGTIEDRDGRLLAVSEDTQSLGVIPLKIRDATAAARTLAALIDGIEEGKLRKRLEDTPKASFLPVKRHLSRREIAAIGAYLENDAKENGKHPERRVEWISLRSTTRRIYLNGTDGAHVLGSVTLDQDEVETGLEGVERTFDSDLRGEPGFALMLKDSRGRDVEPLEELRPVSGKTLRLTIAMPLQHFTDQRLARAVADTGATSGAAVVIDPVTGEILAMSSYPAFDPNVRPNFLPDNLADKTKLTSDPERLRRFNHAISGSYDPGSVAKLFTFAIGADNAGLIKSSSLPCGSIKIGLKTISDHACSGSTTMETALAQSINVPTINIALQIGAEKFEAALTKFGFGSLTGIELPGESPGVLRAKWQGSYLYHAFGYEYRVTPLQLARACSAIARGGLLPNPTVLLWKQGARGEREHPPRKPSERAVGSGSARDILNMSESVILSGTGTEAKSDSYDAGGKTGTAKRVASGTYVKEYDATFAGMIPLKTPRAVVIVTLHRTRKEAAVTAAPAYRDIAAAAMRYLRVGPDHDIHVPPLARLPEPEVLIPELKAAGTADPQKPQTVGRAMPDLRGKNKREVAAVALAMGFQAEFIGQGVAIHQFPLPGTVLGSEQKVKVQFDR